MKVYPFTDNDRQILPVASETGIEIGKNTHIAYNKIKNPRIKLYNEVVYISQNVKICDGAIIYIGCRIGTETIIGHHVVIREATEIGNYCKIGHHTVFEGDTIVGNHTSIQSQCLIAAHTEIGAYVFIGPGVITTNDPVMSYKRPNIEKECKGVTILDGARIGAGCVLFPGITIGREVKIGAGSVVTKDILDYRIVYGNPAKAYRGFVPDNELLKNNGVEI